MNSEEIIEMASQVYGECVWHESALLRLEAFVKLVAAKEREACAKVCEGLTPEWPDQPSIAQAERTTMLDCAAAIRARGEA